MGVVAFILIAVLTLAGEIVIRSQRKCGGK